MTSDPPSREEVKQALLDEATDGPNIDRIMVFATIAKTYADGRLIDRETIDYEAAAALLEADLFVSPTVSLACAKNVIAVALRMGGDDDQ